MSGNLHRGVGVRVRVESLEDRALPSHTLPEWVVPEDDFLAWAEEMVQLARELSPAYDPVFDIADVDDDPELIDDPLLIVTDDDNRRITVDPEDVVGHDAIIYVGGRGNDKFFNRTDLPVIALDENGNNFIEGGPAADLLIAGPGNDRLFGRGGNDVLVGDYTPDRGGNDLLVGGPGDDAFIGGRGNDKFFALLGPPEGDVVHDHLDEGDKVFDIEDAFFHIGDDDDDHDDDDHDDDDFFDDDDHFDRPRLIGLPVFAVGPGRGGDALVRFFEPDGDVRLSLPAFEGAVPGGVRVATGDVTGDGVPELIVGAGPGGGPLVRVFDGVTGEELLNVFAFEESFRGGVFVASGDLDDDGFADIIITPDLGGGPRVRVISGRTGGTVADFFGIEDPNFRGGARAALGDLNGDRVTDLLVAAGFGGGPRVAAFDGARLFGAVPPGFLPPKLFGDLFAFEETLRNGVFPAAGDLDGDGFADVIAGGGPGGGPRVFALSGRELLEGGREQLANFFAGDPANRGGVRLAAKDLDRDDLADLIAGDGEGGGSRVLGFAGRDIRGDGAPPPVIEFRAFPGFSGGVFVG